MPFIGKQSSANSKIKKYSYTATADQTNFAVVSGSGDEIQVFFNGVKLKETDDYTYSTSQVTLGSPASSGDIVDIHVFSSFLIADAVSSSTGGPFGTGNNEYSLPTIRATENDQVLQMTNITNGTVEWKATVVDPSITAVTGQLNATEATGEGGGGTLVITGADLGTNILQVTDVSICNSSGGSPVPATQKSITSSNTEITATWTGTEVGYSSFSGVYYVKLTKSGKTSNIFNSTKQISADPTISSVTGVNGDLFSGSVSSSNLGTYGGTIAGGGEDSNTKLLLNFDRGGGTDIEDSSNTGGDGHKVTATNAVIKSSPFGDGKSAISFLGSDDHLEIDHSTDFNFGAGSSGSSANDFTIEFWVYRNTNNSYQALIGKGDDAGSNSYLTAWFLVSDNSAATNSLKLERNGSTVVGGIWRYETKRWYHIALVRSEDVFTIYVDGKTFASATSTVDLDYSGHLYVGAGANAGPHELNLDGYMDEIRIVKGTAVYTSNFTPPTSRLTAIDDTKLLIHSNQSDDESSNQFSITATDAIQTTTNGRANWGGSNWYSDGSGDYLTLDTIRALGTGNWTVDFWVYPETQVASDTDVLLFDTRTSGSNGWFLSYHKTDKIWRVYVHDGSAFDNHNFSNVVSEVGGWDHIAMEKYNNVVRLWVNGTQASNDLSTSREFKGSLLKIFINDGSSNAHNFKGHLEDIRFSNTARYSGASSITVPTTTFTTDSNTTLLIKGNGANFTDSSASDHTVAPTGSLHSQGYGAIATAMTWPSSKKLTGSSGVYFDGDGDYIYWGANNADFQFGTGDFTIDFWFNIQEFNGSGDSYQTWIGPSSISWGSNNGFICLAFGTSTTDAKARFQTSIASTVKNLVGTTVLSTNTWYHFAAVRNGTSLKLYLNGTEEASATVGASDSHDHGNDHANRVVAIGARQNSATAISFDQFTKVYVDSVRIAKGTAFYTSNFTPPTKIYGAYFPTNPSVGTITITGATTDSTDVAFTEISSSLPNGLVLDDKGAGNQTATITGTLTDYVTSDRTTSLIRIQAKANNDDKRITEVNESSGTGNVSITKKAGGEPVLFNARRYMGNGVAGRDINGFGFAPDMVWVKNRETTNWHTISDVLQGVQVNIFPNENNAQASASGGLQSFNPDGFTVKDAVDFNQADKGIIAWAWKAGGAPVSITSGVTALTNVTQSASSTTGFSITKYSGADNTAGSLPHNLGAKPDFFIIKNITRTGIDWVTWHKDLTSTEYSTGQGDWILLNENKAKSVYANGNSGASDNIFSSATSVTDTHINLVADHSWVNDDHDSSQYICYAWKSVDKVSKFGTYEGTGGALSVSDQSGATNCGFKPRFLIIKRTDGTGHWMMHDTYRGQSLRFIADMSDAEADDTGTQEYYPTFESSGFSYPSTVTHENFNQDGASYIYMAFA